jgi:hypothetical protein
MHNAPSNSPSKQLTKKGGGGKWAQLIVDKIVDTVR